MRLILGAVVCFATLISVGGMAVAAVEALDAVELPSRVDWSAAQPVEPSIAVLEVSPTLANRENVPVLLPLPAEAWAGASLLAVLAAVRSVRSMRRARRV